MLVKVYGSALLGVEARLITIEVNVGRGVGYYLVGLPDSAIRESNYRIAAALLNNGYRIPGKRLTINMAPADLRKEGAAYDLPIAIGVLIASDMLKTLKSVGDYMIMGELSLDGSLQTIKGGLSMALKARELGFRGIILPESAAREAVVVEGIAVYGMKHLQEVVDFFRSDQDFQPMQWDGFDAASEEVDEVQPDFSDVRGQESIKRCMEIAAAGGHNLLLIGPPGSGKTMLAKRLPSILPPMTMKESLETTMIHSVAGKGQGSGLIRQRPFRNPHHTISDIALVGGGSYPQPGEISLSHNGVLFLDELPEFKRSVLEVLRQPLEDREVTISRTRFTVTYPSSFMLVASMNPSPGGYFNDRNAPVVNTSGEIQRYVNRISGPLLDRIDIHMEVNPVPFDELTLREAGESSSVIRKRVCAARRLQQHRFAALDGVHYNAQLSTSLIRRFCELDSASKALLKKAMEHLKLSARAYDRILRVSRTIADLEGSESVLASHIAEAIQYRSMDRDAWGG